jgi:hypothetical protein
MVLWAVCVYRSNMRDPNFSASFYAAAGTPAKLANAANASQARGACRLDRRGPPVSLQVSSQPGSQRFQTHFGIRLALSVSLSELLKNTSIADEVNAFKARLTASTSEASGLQAI